MHGANGFNWGSRFLNMPNNLSFLHQKNSTLAPPKQGAYASHEKQNFK